MSGIDGQGRAKRTGARVCDPRRARAEARSATRPLAGRKVGRFRGAGATDRHRQQCEADSSVWSRGKGGADDSSLSATPADVPMECPYFLATRVPAALHTASHMETTRSHLSLDAPAFQRSQKQARVLTEPTRRGQPAPTQPRTRAAAMPRQCYKCKDARNPLPAPKQSGRGVPGWTCAMPRLRARRRRSSDRWIEQNGPWLVNGQANYVLGQATRSRGKLGNALCAPIVKFTPEAKSRKRAVTGGTAPNQHARGAIGDPHRHRHSLKQHGFQNIINSVPAAERAVSATWRLAQQLGNADPWSPPPEYSTKTRSGRWIRSQASRGRRLPTRDHLADLSRQNRSRSVRRSGEGEDATTTVLGRRQEKNAGAGEEILASAREHDRGRSTGYENKGTTPAPPRSSGANRPRRPERLGSRRSPRLLPASCSSAR